ncbi:MAG: hypothetical protein LBQ54_12450 [Planctomycetaceae bacterium]|nr:hypothetical protein [Planctomycetaceae bacterium]
MKNKLVWFGTAIFMTTLLVGCNDSQMGYVTGKVLIDGEPAKKDLVVRFHPQTPGGSFSTGITDESGNYEMHFSTTKKGVQTGPNRISIEPRATPAGQPAIPEFLKSFNKNSPPVYEVKPGRQTYDIHIESQPKK